MEGVVVGKVAQALHRDEMFCEVLNLLREKQQNTLGATLGALPIDSPVIQRSVCLSPCPLGPS